jgi:hypothetical protein
VTEPADLLVVRRLAVGEQVLEVPLARDQEVPRDPVVLGLLVGDRTDAGRAELVDERAREGQYRPSPRKRCRARARNDSPCDCSWSDLPPYDSSAPTSSM